MVGGLRRGGCCCKKVCYFIVNGIIYIDYKDIELLKCFILECGKILLCCVIGILVKY